MEDRKARGFRDGPIPMGQDSPRCSTVVTAFVSGVIDRLFRLAVTAAKCIILAVVITNNYKSPKELKLASQSFRSIGPVKAISTRTFVSLHISSLELVNHIS